MREVFREYGFQHISDAIKFIDPTAGAINRNMFYPSEKCCKKWAVVEESVMPGLWVPLWTSLATLFRLIASSSLSFFVFYNQYRKNSLELNLYDRTQIFLVRSISSSSCRLWKSFCLAI